MGDRCICRCTSPRPNTTYIYDNEELDSGVPSLNSSTCGSEFHGYQNRTDDRPPRCGPLEEALEKSLIKSEERRSALGESLRNARSALRYQRRCLAGRECDLQNSQSTLENLLQRQEHLESRMCHLKRRNIYNEAGKSNGIKRDSEERQMFPVPAPEVMAHSQRITTLEKEINKINLSLKNSLLPAPSDHSNPFSMYEERQLELEEKLEETYKEAQRMSAKCSAAEQERDSIDLQMVSLRAELHQSNVLAKNLEKQCVELQAQLLASRNINETQHLEMSSLKRLALRLEESVRESENGKKSLHLKLETLEREKQQLQSQKHLLHGMLKTRRRNKQSIRKNESSYGPGQSVETATGTVQEYFGGKQAVSGDAAPISQTSPLGAASRKSKKKYKVEKQFSDQSCRSSKNSGQSEVLAVHQHLGNLLKKLEGLLRSNITLDHDKDQVLKCMLGILEKLKDANVLSGKSRDKVERLLKEHIHLIEDCHKRENQITSVIIELKHLRKAYHGLLKQSEDPEDKEAALWISRVQAIKDSLNILKCQEQKTEGTGKGLFPSEVKARGTSNTFKP